MASILQSTKISISESCNVVGVRLGGLQLYRGSSKARGRKTKKSMELEKSILEKIRIPPQRRGDEWEINPVKKENVKNITIKNNISR